MMKKKLVVVLLVGFAVASPAQSQESKSVKGNHVTIGFIQEGKWARLEAIGSAFRREIKRLTDGEFDVRFPDEKYLVADFSRPRILKAIDRLMKDPEVDMIIGLGPLVSHELCRGVTPSKPVIAPFVLSPEVQNLPLKGDVSGVSTLSYISYPANALRDIEVFRTITPFTRLTVLLGHTVNNGIPELQQAFQEALTAMGIEATHIEVRESAAEATARADCSAQTTP
ncbi:MAG: hypothetical protein WBG01_05440 [Bacteroidota bacterium]